MFGLMRKSTHRKIYVKQGQAYRREIEEAQSAKRVAEAKLKKWVAELTPAIHSQRTIPENNLIVSVEVTPHLQRTSDHELIQLIGREIVSRLYGVAYHRDTRPDLRAPDALPRFVISDPTVPDLRRP